MKIPISSEIRCFQNVFNCNFVKGNRNRQFVLKKYPQLTFVLSKLVVLIYTPILSRLLKEKWGESNDRVREKLLVFIGQMGRDAKQVKISIVTRCDVKKFNGPFNQKCFFFSLSPLKPFSNFCGMSRILTHFQSIWWNGHSPNSLTFSLTCPW